MPSPVTGNTQHAFCAAGEPLCTTENSQKGSPLVHRACRPVWARGQMTNQPSTGSGKRRGSLGTVDKALQTDGRRQGGWQEEGD